MPSTIILLVSDMPETSSKMGQDEILESDESETLRSVRRLQEDHLQWHEKGLFEEERPVVERAKKKNLKHSRLFPPPV